MTGFPKENKETQKPPTYEEKEGTFISEHGHTIGRCHIPKTDQLKGITGDQNNDLENYDLKCNSPYGVIDSIEQK